jgi:uncharacterized protein (UPF0332 family)
MAERQQEYLVKAIESLEEAAAEYEAGRYNNSTNRAYYACLQAAIHALIADGMALPTSGRYGHTGRCSRSSQAD